MLLLLLLACLQAFVPVYRITRTASTASVYPSPYAAVQDIPLPSWTCGQEPGPASLGTARMLDPSDPAKDCVWAVPSTSVLLTGRKAGTTYTYMLTVRTEEWGPWSNPAPIDTAAGSLPTQAPNRLRVIPPPLDVRYGR